jgi:hypothetical protein
VYDNVHLLCGSDPTTQRRLLAFDRNNIWYAHSTSLVMISASRLLGVLVMTCLLISHTPTEREHHATTSPSQKTHDDIVHLPHNPNDASSEQLIIYTSESAVQLTLGTSGIHEQGTSHLEQVYNLVILPCTSSMLALLQTAYTIGSSLPKGNYEYIIPSQLSLL